MISGYLVSKKNDVSGEPVKELIRIYYQNSL